MTGGYKRLKLMAEVQCWAIWDMDGTGNVDPATLPISEELVKFIYEWSSRFDATYPLNLENFGTDMIGFDSKEQEDTFYDDGWKILHQLKNAMPVVDWWYRDMRLDKPVQQQP